MAAAMRVTDAYDEAFEALDRAQEVARAEDLAKELSRIHYYRGSLYFPLGNIDGCLAEHQQALDAAVQAASPEQEALALSGLGDAYYARGQMITALDYFRGCVELSRVHGFGRIEMANQYMIAWNRTYLNEIAGALEDANGAIEAAARAGHKRAEIVAQLAAARLHVERADMVAAERHVEQGLALAESLGANRFKPLRPRGSWRRPSRSRARPASDSWGLGC
jgi:tetratricopeptide (TPR) repeat protein